MKFRVISKTGFVCSVAFLAAAAFALKTPPKPASAAGEFTTVDLDLDQKCQATVIKGTDRNKGTAYVLPRVVISRNTKDERVFQVMRDGNKTIVRVGLYIPNDHSSLKDRLSDDSDLRNNTCTLAEITEALARKFKNSDEPPLKLLRLPINRLRVSMSGIKQAQKIDGSTDNLTSVPVEEEDFSEEEAASRASVVNNTAGLLDTSVDYFFEFPLHTESEYQAFLKRLTGAGVQFTVSMDFMAQEVLRYDSVSIDGKKIAAEIGAKFKGRLDKLMTVLELQAAVSTAVASVKAELYSEGTEDSGDSPFLQVAIDLVNRYINADVPGFSDQSVSEDSEAKYTLSAFMKFAKERQSFNLKYMKMGRPQPRHYTTATTLKAYPTSEGSSIYKAWNGGDTLKLPQLVRAGDRITFAVEDVWQKPFAGLSPPETRKLSIADIERLERKQPGWKGLFPYLKKLTASDIKSVGSGRESYAYHLIWPSAWVGAFNIVPGGYVRAQLNAIKEVTWREEVYTPLYGRKQKLTPEYELTPQNFKKLKLKFRFGDLNKSCYMHEMGPGKKCKDVEIVYDEDTYSFTMIAHADLGPVTMYNEQEAPWYDNGAPQTLVRRYEYVQYLLKENSGKQSGRAWADQERVPGAKLLYAFKISSTRPMQQEYEPMSNMDMPEMENLVIPE